MGNVTSNGLGRGSGKGLRRQQKHQRQQAVASQRHYQTHNQQQPRLKANNNRRNKLNARQRQLVGAAGQQHLHHHHQHPFGSHTSAGDLHRGSTRWSPHETLTSSHYYDSHHYPLRGPHAHSASHHQIYLDDLYGGSHPHHHQPAAGASAALRSEFVSPAVSYELISSQTHSNSTPPSTSSTAAAGPPPIPFDQYDGVAYQPHPPANPYYHYNYHHSHHQPPPPATTATAYDDDDDCELLRAGSPFNRRAHHQLAGLHITQPPLHCLDSCCNPPGPASPTGTTSAADGQHQATRSRRMNPSGGRRPAQKQPHNGAGGDNQNGSAVADARLAAALERGLSLNEEERRRRGLLGLLPAAVQDQALQARVVLDYVDKCQDELAKYVYLRNLKDFNESLFYYTLTRNVEKLMPIVYTPTVGLACQRFSQIYMRPRGLYVTATDSGRVAQVVANWPERDVRVIVVTDGERILGLGDLGANGMGISIGKLSLYTALAGISPQNVMPVTIDVGTNNQSLLDDPFYIGLRQKRVRGDKYDALVEEFMQACASRWGRSCLIQFEDFANSTAFNLLERYRRDYCTFNDDIQGTASVSLAGLITAARLIGRRLSDCTFLFYGAGEANLGTAQLLIMAMLDEGSTASRDEAKQRIWLVDSKGLVVKGRDDLNEHKRQLAQDAEHIKDLEAIIDLVKPSAIVGASAQGGSFTESICKKMAQYNERPIIFALSNPTSKAECTAEQAYQWTEGTCVFASGSPFEPVQYGQRTFITGQGNNAYIFPGVGLAAIAAHTHIVPEEVFLVAARALSDQVTSDDTQVGLVYPSLTKIREVTLNVATRVLEYFYAERLATYRPEPSDKRAFLQGIQYDPTY
jgi:malate dehydrogenase (oxaloacetate-decarboxylating)(NADP+)